jgi:uroporphyrinogen decarboxylase
LEATKYVIDNFAGEVPVLGTLFTPLSFYKDMITFCSPDGAAAAIKYNPDELHKVLTIITETSIAFMDELARIGADGMFIASHFCEDNIPEIWFEEFCRPYDMKILEHAGKLMWFNMLHVHGTHGLRIDRFLDYPCQALNWEDCILGPDSGFTMRDKKKKTDRIFIGGIDLWSDFYSETNDREAVKAVLIERGRDAIESAGFDKLILATGCAAPQDIPPYRFTLMQEVAEELTCEYGR